MFRQLNNSESMASIYIALGDDFVAYVQSASLYTTQATLPFLHESFSDSVVAKKVGPVYSIAMDIVAHETGRLLSYAGARSVLMDAANQPMTASLFNDLQAAATSINTATGPKATIYVQQMFGNVVLGNSANAYWNGGSAPASTLGNLSATSTTPQFDKLIGKWFLGTDMPGDASAPGNGSAGIAYNSFTLPLFTSAGPKLTDVSQGQVGDCWFLAALSETAMQDPSLISKMIAPHGATYSVEFWVNGKPDFVTVNSALPTYTDGSMQFDGSLMTSANSTTSLWVPLVEKALAQLSEQTNVVTGMEYGGGQNQYYELNSGGGESISLITDQQSAGYSLSALSSSDLTSLLGQMHVALAGHEDMMLATSEQAVSGSLIADHMFGVTGVDAAAGTVSLYNPWGGNAAGAGKPESFTIAATALEADNAYFYAALGTAKVA